MAGTEQFSQPKGYSRSLTYGGPFKDLTPIHSSMCRLSGSVHEQPIDRDALWRPSLSPRRCSEVSATRTLRESAEISGADVHRTKNGSFSPQTAPPHGITA